ncbi:MAG: DUF5018 domain-containing protein [Bacteroidales bacterium]|nr:DUF5018 domain-containing protein [Candidatus Cryptobacteroides aphodequi]
MKKIIILALAALCTLAACHEPEYVKANADRQGLTSLTAIILDGEYAGQEISKLDVSKEMYEDGNFVIEIPYYFPETSEEQSTKYMTRLRVQAELQPDYKISPSLGLLDLTEINNFTLTDPDGKSRPITITSKRVKSTACSLLSLLVEDYMVSGVIYEAQKKVLIPSFEDMSNVKVSGQVSSHAQITKIGGKTYTPDGTYNLSTGSSITVLAANGTTSATYEVAQGIPELLPYGMNLSSVKQLFNVEAVTLCGLPAYNENCFVSLAGSGNSVIVCTGSTTAPSVLNCFTGQKTGELNVAPAVADAITNDDAGHILLVNFAQGGDAAQTVNIYRMNSATDTPALLHSFTNPIDVPVGHRIKVLGDIDADAVITLTAEGVDGITLTAKAVVIKISAGAVSAVEVKDFASYGFGWGSAPINYGTIVPASLEPDADGWYLDYYEGNADADGSYLLHYINGGDTVIDKVGDWGQNPNCLDVKTFNGSRYMTLFVVSHFPQWGYGPRLYLYEVSSPESPSRLLANESIKWFQKETYSPDFGASGDVVMVPTTDGYRMYVYYYDHHCQTIGAFVADCFVTE